MLLVLKRMQVAHYKIYFFQVLRDQGLGKYCDPEFVRAASREMQEAMDMTPEEFDAAAHQLLAAERQGTLRLPVGPESSGWGHQVWTLRAG